MTSDALEHALRSRIEELEAAAINDEDKYHEVLARNSRAIEAFDAFIESCKEMRITFSATRRDCDARTQYQLWSIVWSIRIALVATPRMPTREARC